MLVRCDSCGATRWSLLRVKAGGSETQECDICGGELKVERRRPGRRFAKAERERRDARTARGAPRAPA
jgi:ribosome-binding protein aMBF1 (putative translation factor)